MEHGTITFIYGDTDAVRMELDKGGFYDKKTGTYSAGSPGSL